ncbi:MAG: hypothetical protein HXY25_06075, partial [Alphaproteobacteria bacterium]|nr:hypothetical protein [Alphaproteobacteria bacterium]
MGRNLRIAVFLAVLAAAGALAYFATQHIEGIEKLAADATRTAEDGTQGQPADPAASPAGPAAAPGADDAD